ncbi:protein phosphatase 2C domain-containing protein [Aerosakkonemataceae cyanobacterium BLCC-F50]|uniref:Protein phosphatase 2C domain-containing protein n=1 Tax=Floridaenema flaviceps BLCC-F50 TaxID=3153642 RepID=A0ABV4XKU7_9CYAN
MRHPVSPKEQEPPSLQDEKAEPSSSYFEQELPTELEELVEPLSMLPMPEPLAADALVAAPYEQSFRIVMLRHTESQINFYEAVNEDEQTVSVREALSGTEAAARSRHEAEVLRDLDCPMFPQLICCFESDLRTFLVTEPLAIDPTLADVLASVERQLPEIVSILAQVTFALSRLHAHGWVNLGLRPSHILSNPIKILDCSYATRIGEKPNRNFSHAGYSPPELSMEASVDARDDIYAVGAMLYQAVTGQKIPETGPELSFLPPIAGVRQILSHCLGSRESRYAQMEDLHRDLLRLKKRLEPTVSYSLAAATSIGLEPTRTTNQDAYGYLTGELVFETEKQAWAIATIADGMGGMAAGEVASEVAVKTLLAEAAKTLTSYHEMTTAEQVEWVKQWVSIANQKVCAVMEKQRARGGCTLVCACLVNQCLTVAHVGDCRLYLLRQNEVTLLTRDHSVAQAQVLQNQIQLEEVRRHPDRNQLTRSLGDHQPLPDYYIDTLEQTTGQTVMELRSGDVLLLCSDGLWEPVLEADMLQAVCNLTPDLKSTANELLKIALQRGAPDNATVVLLRLEETTVPKE